MKKTFLHSMIYMHKNIEYLSRCAGLDQYLYETNANLLNIENLMESLCAEKNRFEKNFPFQDFWVILNFRMLEKDVGVQSITGFNDFKKQKASSKDKQKLEDGFKNVVQLYLMSPIKL